MKRTRTNRATCIPVNCDCREYLRAKPPSVLSRYTGWKRRASANLLLHRGAFAILNTVTDTKTTRLARLAEINPLALALALSLVIHLGAFGGWHLGKKLGWWQHQPTWLVNLTRKIAAPAKARTAEEQKKLDRSIAMTFVEVDPATAVTEEPKDAKFYGAKNSKATNPDPKDLPKPKVDGKQDQVVRLEDNKKPIPFPLQPAPKKDPKTEAPVDPKPKAAAPGDLALLKPNKPSDGQIDATTGDSTLKPKSRPRTVAEAKASKGILTGEKLRQDGGASRHGSVAFDVKASPFGEYDAAFISAVERCWHGLLDSHQGLRRAGRVTIDFVMHPDGRITNLKVAESSVSEVQAMLCQSAIYNPAPYGRWPAAMRQKIGEQTGKLTRDVRFTFIYYN